MSNTPLQYVAHDFRMDGLIVQVDLFSGLGDLPRNLDQVQERVKDIQFQSKTRFSHDQMRQLEELRGVLADVLRVLKHPESCHVTDLGNDVRLYESSVQPA